MLTDATEFEGNARFAVVRRLGAGGMGLLYEALAGRLPFDGSSLQIMTQKQEREPPPPRTCHPEVAADLDALCLDLLRVEPRARPTAAQVLRCLGVRDEDEAAPNMLLCAAVARRRRGELIGGAEGTALVQAADAWMAEQGIKQPTRMAAVIGPGFGRAA